MFDNPIYRQVIEKLVTRYRGNFIDYFSQQLKIKTKDQRLAYFDPNPMQMKILIYIAWCLKTGRPIRIIILKARQIGLSTLSEALLFWYCSLNPNVNGITMAHDKATSEKLFEMCKIFYTNLSPLIRPLRRYSSKKELVFEKPERIKKGDPTTGISLGSQIQIQTAGNVHAGTGTTTHFLHLSEIGRYPFAQEMKASMFPSVPYKPKTFIIEESTAWGAGSEFYDDWQAAKTGESNFYPFFFAWHDNPEYQVPLQEGEEFILEPEEQELVRLYGCTPAQLNWRRHMLKEYEPQKFMQEFPACLTGETRISTEGGMIPISEARKFKTTESGKIENVMIQTASEIFKLTTKMGRILRGTFNHPIHTPEDEFIFLGKLKSGQKISLKPPRFADRHYVVDWNPIPGMTSYIKIDEQWGRFLGYFMGDGSWHNGIVSIGCDYKDQDVVDDVVRIISNLIAVPTKREIGKIPGRPGMTEIRVGCIKTKEPFIQMNLIKSDRNAYRRNVHVPECIFRSPKSVVKQFLKGLFECDGSASMNIVRWGSSKLEFARDVQLLLLGFGINVKIKEQTKQSGGKYPYKFYEVVFRSVEAKIFFEEIGFIGKRKNGIKDHYLKQHPNRVGRKANPMLMQDEVESIEECRKEITYDMTIADTHIFSANGILTHNSEIEAWQTAGFKVFDTAVLEDLRLTVSNPRYVGRLDTNRLMPIYENHPEMTNYLAVWEVPKHNLTYDIGVDVSLGSEGGDYTAIVVIERDTKRCVALWKGLIDPFDAAIEAEKIGIFYNYAQINCEVNSIGYATNGKLAETYPNLYRWKIRDEQVLKLTRKTGYETTHRSKKYLVSLARTLLRKRPPIRSKFLFEELTTYVDYGDDFYRAAPGFNDDCIQAFMLAMVASDDEKVPNFIEADTEEGPRESVEAHNRDDWAPEDRVESTNIMDN